MAELNDNDNALRTVTLESVAEYLRCDSQRLATALRRLAETPRVVVKYGIGESACITPAMTLYSNDARGGGADSRGTAAQTRQEGSVMAKLTKEEPDSE